MGRQALFVNWFCSSYLYINTKKTILIDSTYFKKIWEFLTLLTFFPLLGFPLLRYSLLVTSLLCLVTPQLFPQLTSESIGDRVREHK